LITAHSSRPNKAEHDQQLQHPAAFLHLVKASSYSYCL
jgi:hypothetical protein